MNELRVLVVERKDWGASLGVEVNQKSLCQELNK